MYFDSLIFDSIVYILDRLIIVFQVTMETTIGNSNADLWKYVHPDESVLEGNAEYM